MSCPCHASHAGGTRTGASRPSTVPRAEPRKPGHPHAPGVPGPGFAHDFSRVPARAKPYADTDGGGAPAPAQAPAPAPARPAKSIGIYAVSLPGSTRDATTDIATAGTVWAQCGLGVTLAGGESWATDLLDTLDPKASLNEFSSPSSPTQEELDLLAHHPGGKSTIHAYFVPAMSGGSRGESFAQSISPNGVLAVIVSDSAESDTFAHELGHVLMNDGSHHSDPDNLMASGSIRNVGVDKLDAAQCARV